MLKMLNDSDTLFAMGSAAWDGVRWDTIAHRIDDWNGINSTAGPIQWYLRFGGDLYAIGSFVSYDPIDQRNVLNMARLDTSQQRWKAISECELDLINSLTQLGPREPSSLLYLTGFRDTLCGPEEGNIFTYDGNDFTKWDPFDELQSTSNGTYVGWVFEYQGMTYVTGGFRNPFDNSWTSMMRYNGLQWETIPGWHTNGPVKDYTIQDGILYLGGAFHQYQGAPGNLVVAYDGQNWNDLGGGLAWNIVPNGAVTDLQWFQGELWACGVFIQAGGPINAGGIIADRIAKWNGQQWCSLPGNIQSNGPLNEMAVWRDSLYLCGAFNTIDGVTMNKIAQWVGGDATVNCSQPVGVEEHIAQHPFTIYPNPTTGLLHMELHGLRPRELFVSDALGRKVLRQGVPLANTGPLTLDLAPLSPGAYLVTVVDEQGMRFTQRVVRE